MEAGVENGDPGLGLLLGYLVMVLGFINVGKWT